MWCRYGGVVKLTTDKWLTADFGYPGSSESQKYTRNCRFEILLRECHFNKCFGWNSRCNSPSTYFVYSTRIWVIIGVLWGSLKQLTVTLIDREGEGIPVTWSHFLIQASRPLMHIFTRRKKYINVQDWIELNFFPLFSKEVTDVGYCLLDLYRQIIFSNTFGVNSEIIWNRVFNQLMGGETHFRHGGRERERIWCAAPLGNVFLLTSASMGSHV